MNITIITLVDGVHEGASLGGGCGVVGVLDVRAVVVDITASIVVNNEDTADTKTACLIVISFYTISYGFLDLA